MKLDLFKFIPSISIHRIDIGGGCWLSIVFSLFGKKMTKFKLFVALAARAESTDSILTIDGITGRVLAVEKEDGSGMKFNVLLAFVDGTKKWFFVKTVD